MTPPRQRNAVSEGAALGLVLCERYTLDFHKVTIDLAFTGAWRSWPYSTRFPQVGTDIGKGLDGAWALTRADEKKHTMSLYWDGFTIRLRKTWEGTELDPDEMASWIDGDVPAAGWQALAEEFLARAEH